jgi:hypothetical protein
MKGFEGLLDDEPVGPSAATRAVYVMPGVGVALRSE